MGNKYKATRFSKGYNPKYDKINAPKIGNNNIHFFNKIQLNNPNRNIYRKNKVLSWKNSKKKAFRIKVKLDKSAFKNPDEKDNKKNF